MRVSERVKLEAKEAKREREGEREKINVYFCKEERVRVRSEKSSSSLHKKYCRVTRLRRCCFLVCAFSSTAKLVRAIELPQCRAQMETVEERERRGTRRVYWIPILKEPVTQEERYSSLLSLSLTL